MTGHHRAVGRPGGRASTRAGLALIGVICAVALGADVLAPGDPFTTSDDVLLPPSWAHPFGSDDFGRDVFTAIVHGARICLLVALAATVAAMSLGIAVGATAGYVGGHVDDLLMRVTEVFQVVPRFFLVVTTVALFGSGLGLVIVIIALTSWSSTARLVRGQVMSAATFDHVMAARAAGARPIRVIARHILPMALPPLLAHAAFQGSGAILAEAGVSFLGLGDPSVMTWGALLHEAHHFLRVAWWLAVFPGLALTLTVLGLHLLADGLGDAR
jgi:peptide/nickel transport system permease protein